MCPQNVNECHQCSKIIWTGKKLRLSNLFFFFNSGTQGPKAILVYVPWQTRTHYHPHMRESPYWLGHHQGQSLTKVDFGYSKEFMKEWVQRSCGEWASQNKVIRAGLVVTISYASHELVCTDKMWQPFVVLHEIVKYWLFQLYRARCFVRLFILEKMHLISCKYTCSV